MEGPMPAGPRTQPVTDLQTSNAIACDMLYSYSTHTHTHTNEIMPSAATWTDLECTMLSEGSLTGKNKY